jgi:HSP20 family molecular chaperone IbpA
MSSFLDKLKGVVAADEAQKNAEPSKEPKKKEGMLQLDVNVSMTRTDIVIHVFIPAVRPDDLDISIEEEGDVVTIQGKREKPLLASGNEEDIKLVHSELKWGQFFRQIILPQEVSPTGAEARINRGLLTIKMPLLKIDARGKRKIKIGEQKVSNI